MNKHHPSLTTLTARLLVVPAVVAAGIGASAAVAGAPAAADEPSITCGSVVTTDVRLDADLVDCAGTGLVIGAPGITVDLGGHVIDGTGSGTGIDNSAGHDDVHITGGTVREFLFGVHLFRNSGARIAGFAAESNNIGVIVERSERVELDRVTATGNSFNGVEIDFSDRIVVRRSTAAGNGHAGIVDRASTDSSYVRNTVTGNVAPGLDLWQSHGLVVERNHVIANDSDGILLTGVEDAVVERNEAVANNGNGISIDEPGNTVTRNQAIANQGIGIAAPDGTIDGGRNQAIGNVGGDCTAVLCT